MNPKQVDARYLQALNLVESIATAGDSGAAGNKSDAECSRWLKSILEQTIQNGRILSHIETVLTARESGTVVAHIETVLTARESGTVVAHLCAPQPNLPVDPFFPGLPP